MKNQDQFDDKSRPIVCVQGLGFVGLAMATVVANSLDTKNNPIYNVIGIDLPSNKDLIEKINKGILPFKTEDKTFSVELKKAVLFNKNLLASTDKRFYSEADIIIVDVHLDVKKYYINNKFHFKLEKKSFERAIRTLGRLIKSESVVIIETTVPPGFCINVVKPILDSEFKKRNIKSAPLIVHSYERVMPGREYLNSIRNYFRTFAGIDKKSAKLGKRFLESVINSKEYPLKEEQYTEASEFAKILENSYRATNIAFIYEWTLLAEKVGINLFSVIDGIKNRRTHNNIMKPGLGVGGYCLTKDSLLALWSAKNLYKSKYGLPFSINALSINDKMPLHVIDLIKEKTKLENKKVLILGISYREDVSDSRYSPTQTLFASLIKYKNLKCTLHDPYIDFWKEVPEAVLLKKLDSLKSFDIVILATRHHQYLSISSKRWVKLVKSGCLIVDANDILNDNKINYLLNHNIDVIGVGKGHINKMKVKI